MKTIGQVWMENKMELGIKVRWRDWGHKHIYFTIEGLDQDQKRVVGTLDSGEKISYPMTSKGWKVYYPGDELTAKAV